MSILNFKYEKKSGSTEEQSKKGKASEVDTKGQTETFFTRNVRLITFLICLGVFLTVLGPWSVFRIKSCIDERRAAANAMTVEDILTLAERRGDLYMSDFEDFTKDIESESFYLIKVESLYLVTVRSDSADGRVNYFVVENLSTKQSINVLSSEYSPAALQALLGR